MVCLMVITAKRKRQQGKEKGKGRAIVDQVPRKALTNKMTVDQRGEGRGQIRSFSPAGDGTKLLSCSARYRDAVPGGLVSPGLWSSPV